MRILCRFIWDAAEWLRLDLGPLAPWVFGKMIGAKGKRVEPQRGDYL